MRSIVATGTLLLQLLAADGVEGAKVSDLGHAHRAYRRECPVEPQIIALRWEPETGKYKRIAWNRSDDGHRKLQEERTTGIRGKMKATKQDVKVFSAVDSVIRRGLSVADVIDNEDEPLPVDNTELDHAVLFRSCSCHDVSTVYCPLEVDHCAEIRHYNETRHGPSPLVCLDKKERMDEFAETTFLIVFLWMSILLSFIVVTQWGRNCVHCLVAQCVPGYNKFLAWFLLRTNRELAREMLHQHVYSRRHMTMERLQQVSPELAFELMQGQTSVMNQTVHPMTMKHQSAKPTALALKTRTFTSDTSVKNDVSDAHEEEVQGKEFDHDCAICFQPVEDGELVGDLTCKHLFHADCLKTWLQRRNACPLCNANEIAAPRFNVTGTPKPSEETDSMTNSRAMNERSTEDPTRSEDSITDGNNNASEGE
eukprot:scaffold11575_cov179-Amphora_coffeaeformis.AAC.2